MGAAAPPASVGVGKEPPAAAAAKDGLEGALEAMDVAAAPVMAGVGGCRLLSLPSPGGSPEQALINKASKTTYNSDVRIVCRVAHFRPSR